MVYSGFFEVFYEVYLGDRAITEAKVKAKKIIHNTIIYGGITIIKVMLIILFIALVFRSF